MRPIRTAVALLLVACVLPLSAQVAERQWQAAWITHPAAPLREPIVLHFRKSFTLIAIPTKFLVRVSADNRFVLYANGKRVGDGPARGDMNHWRYQTFDLAPYLISGENRLTAVVWNFGVYAPVAQITDRTAFLLEGEGNASLASTGEGWQVEIENGRQCMPRQPEGFSQYFAVGPGERLNAAQYDWDWQTVASRANWVEAASPMRDDPYSRSARARSADETDDVPWGLVPDTLPPMTYEATDPGHVVRSELEGATAFPTQAITVPASRRVHVLLDRGTLITAYPSLTVSGGRDARIRLTYSEALYDENQKKGDRNQVGQRVALGTKDEFLPDGGTQRTFETLWWRTWRYLDLEITTAGEPLTLNAVTAHSTMYPFEENASFHSADTQLDDIWNISWRTARLDAHETYMDTPYYEQLQYIGDTRIQALISYAVTNDDRLARQAIRAFDDSRLPEGITASRYPTEQLQIIPPFSLLWIGMLHDYWMYRPDPQFVQQSLPGMRAVLDWFERHEAPDHLLRELPWWSFIDWTMEGRKLPSYGPSKESCVTSLQYLGALQQSAALESALGDSHWAVQDKSRAETLRSSLYDNCWDPPRELFADTPEKSAFSQQANMMAVLYDVIPASEQQRVLERILSIQPGQNQGDITSASYYFRFYLSRALDHAGMADHYLESISPWRALLSLHFSTWPEVPGDTRSDSHAWSAHPIYDLLTLVAGVEPAAPGFSRVRIAPHLGALPTLQARYPHPRGIIAMDYRRTAAGLDATITVPENVSATFAWHGQEQPLQTGVNHLKLR
ncbi:MAG TPA: alpha-L-rhamnosidase C-terminal domain-containing protein [Terriglobales bacterium]